MTRYSNEDLGEVSEGVLEQPLLGKSLAENGTGTLTERVGEETMRLGSGEDREKSSWLRRNLNNLKWFYNLNQEGLALLIAGTLADVATTCLVLSSEYGGEMMSVPKQMMASLGTGYGLVALKTGVIGVYTLASIKLGPILDNILKSKTATEKLFAYAGYTQLGLSALNFISYMGANL